MALEQGALLLACTLRPLRRPSFHVSFGAGSAEREIGDSLNTGPSTSLHPMLTVGTLTAYVSHRHRLGKSSL